MDATQREFNHASLGLTLVLKNSADDLTQGDVDRFLMAYQRLTGTDDSKTLRAAFEAGWIEKFSNHESSYSADHVLSMKRRVAKWGAQQVNAVYIAAEEVPKA